MKILMVCLGNICRSPLAEGILKQKIHENGLPWEVDSAGTGYWHIGEPPDPRSIATARRHGIDITGQRARQIQSADLDRFDLILAMDQANYREVLRLASTDEQRNKVGLIMNYALPGSDQPVPDPYWDDDGFEKIFAMLRDACQSVVEAHRR